MKFTVNPSQMNLTWYIIYGGCIMSIWWKQQSICEAAATKLLRCIAFGEFSQEEEESGFHWTWVNRLPVGPKDCARHTVKCNTSLYQAAKQLCAFCWTFWKIRVWLKQGHKENSLLQSASELLWQLMPAGTRKDVSFWLQNIYWWAWIDGHVVFCHPVPHWSW